MGWGCYKHEVDAGSEAWGKKLVELCDLQLKREPRTWGRDSQICPWCHEELEAENERLVQAIKDAPCPFGRYLESKTNTCISCGKISKCWKRKALEHHNES